MSPASSSARLPRSTPSSPDLLDGDLRARPRGLEVEDPEVAPHHVHRDVVDRDRADAALEGARVCVPVEHEGGAVLGDREGEALAPEEHMNALRLTLERLRDRRVVEEHDLDVAVDD